MKKNLISLAVAAGVLGATAAHSGTMSVSPDGTGQVLLFPFYNADNGNATNMHIVNTSATETKALKIRFVEHKNSYEVLDFNLYLSPKDHFAFGVIKDPNGTGGAVITQDNSCTVPALGGPNGAFSGTATTAASGAVTRIQPFVNYQYVALKEFDQSIERTLTGHVEVIEMGNVGDVDTKTGAHASFAKHGATGVPASCAGLEASWADYNWSSDDNAGVSAPTGGLYGLAYHINVEAAAAFGFEPTAIEGFNDGESHAKPGDLFPTLNEAGANQNGVVYSGGGGANSQYAKVVGASVIETVSALLMTDRLTNDVMINPAIGGMTDWVVTFPTKRLHVGSTLVAPFTDKWVGIEKNAAGTGYQENQACETVAISQSDREEAFTANTNGFSPSPAQASTKICNEVAVIAMGAAGTASALSATTGLTNLGFPYAEGWMSMTFAQTMNVGGNTTMTGLPAVGFAAYKVSNGAMSYGNASEHKTNVTGSLTVIALP
jgi:hypothetical protein